jgi:hypothetical protein
MACSCTGYGGYGLGAGEVGLDADIARICANCATAMPQVCQAVSAIVQTQRALNMPVELIASAVASYINAIPCAQVGYVAPGGGGGGLPGISSGIPTCIPGVNCPTTGTNPNPQPKPTDPYPVPVPQTASVWTQPAAVLGVAAIVLVAIWMAKK